MSRLPRDRAHDWGRWLIAFGLACSAAWLGLRAYCALGYVNALERQAAEMQAFVSAHGQALLASPESMASLQEALQVMDAELAALEQESAPFLGLGRFLGWAPYVGDDLRAAPHLLTMAHGVVRLGLGLGSVLRETQALNGVGEGWVPAFVLALNQDPEATAGLRRAFEETQAARRQVNAGRLHVVQTLAAPLAEWDRLAPTLATGLRVVEALPTLLGADRPRVYLILAQNENELRPTGGFITAVGTLRVEAGRITALEIRDSYAFDDLSQDYPWPPAPLQDYMLSEMWLLRDANWSPDFPESAETAAGLFRLSTGEEVDGVVAFDQVALRYLVEAVGAVDVPGDGGLEPVTAQNFTQWMYRRWAPARDQEQNAQWWVGRKSFVADLAGVLRSKIETQGDVDMLALVRAVSRALDEKHALMYGRELALAELLAATGWDGRVERGTGDYLMAVEANVGFNKASPMIERRLEQRVALDAVGGADETVRLTYRHRGVRRDDACDHTSRYDPVYTMMMDRCYWNYLRLVVPAGAELKSAPYIVVPWRNLISGKDSKGTVDVQKVGETRQSWGQLTLMKPGSTLAMEYAYRVPAAAVELDGGRRRYRLVLQKQPGLQGLPISLGLTLPEGSRLLSSEPKPTAASGTTLRYELDLITDQTVTVGYAP